MTTPQTQQPEKSKEPTYAPQTKLAVVYFRESVTFGGELQSASVPRVINGSVQRGSNSVDEIRAAWVDDDGALFFANADRGPDGLALRSKVHDQHSGKRIVRQTFVPWSNVRSIGYME